MADSVDRVFVHALNTVKRIPRTGTARPPAAERLKLYGLYKQSMEGDVEGVMDRPIGNTPEVHAECEKWDAWYEQRGISRTEAKRRYIGTLIDTMHTYASQTPEARELVSELEFVWDQIKYNASSSSGSGPLNAVGVPPLSRHQGSSYGSINGRLLSQSPEHYDRPNIRADDGHDSRLRVLSPVSQPEEEEYYRRRRRRLTDDMDEQAIEDDDEDEDDEDEEYEEARDSLYEHQDNASTTADTTADTNTGTEPTASHGDDRSQHRHHRHRDSMAASGTGDLESNSHHRRDSHDPSNPRNSRWRRRVEQALTKMTAEIAAVREQMETRTLSNRRRSGLWAWLKWILWTVTRQIIWDLALLAALLIWMRMRGDRRVEDRLRTGWSELKTRLGRFKLLSRFNKAPLLP
ncbi:hypothetical protein N7509_007085 [Penicillium cosmopolitanum]|uniref:ACB domain-containing protein n=1 Tax=Penicillium cosmopolitanum TaxID=1131564 RepID=A0A9X0B801_9EURO|nr:uncharacterized protein N7509_007085 [Penicillium cosmopolitanum]KAJ5391595.1 hypothetical protein N7509_007085 [Penicillium cosmopolitanum]